MFRRAQPRWRTVKWNIIIFILGTPEDRVLASSIAALLCVQLGAGSESQVVFKTLKPHLITVIQDKTAVSAARASVSDCQLLCPLSSITHYILT